MVQPTTGISPAMVGYDRPRAIAAAESILAQDGWCVIELCSDLTRHRWEARALIFDLTPEAVADTVEEELEDEPGCDARLTGCSRRTLHPDPRMGAFLCHLAENPRSATRNAPAPPVGGAAR